jgi:hypothetical protein
MPTTLSRPSDRVASAGRSDYRCWCRHLVDDHVDGYCRMCRKVWPHLMQPTHRFARIELMRPIRSAAPHHLYEFEAKMLRHR